MKYLRRFNESINRSEIDAICKYYDIDHYTINDDGSIDVDGDVNLSNKKLTKLPLKFRKVTGNFYCYNNQLTTLEGAPKSVGEDFDCGYNQLTTLEGSPIHVGEHFACHKNQLTSLEYAPKYVGEDFYCYDNKLKNIDKIPNRYKELYIYKNPIFFILRLFVKTVFYENTYYIKDTEENKELIGYFNDREIIQNDILLLDRLVEFLEDIGKPPQTKEYLTKLLKRKYEIR